MLKNQVLHLQKDTRLLLVINGLFTIAVGLSNTFVNVFIWRIKKDLGAIGLFNLFIYIFLPLTFILAGYISKKRDGVFSLRLGIIFHTLFFLVILIAREESVGFLVPLGSLLGIAGGFYWLGFHLLSFDLTNELNRDTFNSYNGLLGSLGGMTAPLIAGFVIVRMMGLSGYYLIFGITLLIFLLIVLISSLLHTRNYQGAFQLYNVIKESSSNWQYLIIGFFFFGIRKGVFMFIINLITYIISESELTVGTITLLGGIVAMLSYQLIERVMKPDKRILFIRLGTTMMFIAVLSLLGPINLISMIVFVSLVSFFYPFFIVPFNSAGYNLIDQNKQTKQRIELIVYRELALNLGRVIGIIAFILTVNNSKEIAHLKTFLLMFGSSPLLIPFLLRGINRNTDVLSGNLE